jgi:hypothetical protein
LALSQALRPDPQSKLMNAMLLTEVPDLSGMDFPGEEERKLVDQYAGFWLVRLVATVGLCARNDKSEPTDEEEIIRSKMFHRMGFKENKDMQHCFYVAALTQFARFQACGGKTLDPEVSWRKTSWDKIERFLNDMRTSFAAHSLSKLERAVIPPLRDGNEYKLEPVTYSALLGYDFVLDIMRLLCALYMQHIMENKLPREVANAVPDCMKLSSEEMEKNETYKHDDPVDISKAGNMKDLFLPLHVIPDSENPGDKDAYNKALSDKENRHDVKNAKEFAEQWHVMQKQQQVDWMTLVQLVVCGSNALTFMHRAVTGRESGRSSHVADGITKLQKFKTCRNKAVHKLGKGSILNPLALLRGEFFIESSKLVCNVADEAEQWACKSAKNSSDEYRRTVNHDTLENCTVTQMLSFQGDHPLKVPQRRSNRTKRR